MQDAEHGQGLALRPYPSGGAIHELEVYVIVNRCEGLDRGVYHYGSASHELHMISVQNGGMDALIEMASRTLASPMQLLLIITARFQRVQWKYQSMAYALILKNVGVLMQTMCLTATAMNLGGCALGGGHSDLFASMTGLDYYTEGSVGEFLLGAHI